MEIIDGGTPSTVFRTVDETVEVSIPGDTTWGWVTGYDLPLTVDDGPMRLDVGISA